MRALANIALLLLLTGCLSRPSLVKESFAFATPSVTDAARSSGPVLGVRRIFVASPFDSLALTYRTGDFSYERDPYAGFLAPPEESLAEPLRAYLRNSGSFREVIEPGSALKPQIELEISVTQLYGDFRNRSRPAAVLRMRLLAFDPSSSAAAVPFFEKEYGREVPLHARTAAALVAGWNEALKQITTAAAADLKSKP